jgi:hypothetical protein
MGTRLAAAALVAAAALTAATPVHAAGPSFGGACDGVIDFGCYDPPCGEDELDCGMRVCFVWIPAGCILRAS